MDSKQQVLVNSIIKFLRNQLETGQLDEEKKESLEVAIQCLETAFETEEHKVKESVDLLSFINVPSNPTVTDEQKEKAEVYKVKGNDFMKTSEYAEALVAYTKAIDLNPHNAVYFCNRAAAYTRLGRDTEAMEDCNNAIKLEPTYGKAYGRLGIAYSNLNQFRLAADAYKNALKYDPSNAMYETNLKVAIERCQSAPASAGSRGAPFNLGELPENLTEMMANPQIINMASQILSDRNFTNMMSGFVNNLGANPGQTNQFAVETMIQAGQVLAERLASEDPEYYSRLARNAQEAAQAGQNPSQGDRNGDPAPAPPDSSDKKTE